MILSITETLQIARHLFDNDKYQEAQRVCMQLLASEPTNLDGLLLMGKIGVKTGEFKKALQFLEKLLAIDETHLEGLEYTGLSYQLAKNFSKAAEYFQQALNYLQNNFQDLKQDISKMRVYLATIYQQQGQLDKAAEICRKAISSNKENPLAHHNMGNIYCHFAMWQEALDCYYECVKLAPENTLARKNLAILLRDQQQINESSQHLEAALLCEPANTEFIEALGQNAMMSGDYENAVKQFSKSLKIQPKSSQASLQMAKALEMQGELNKALALYASAVKSESTNITAYWHLALALRKTGKIVEAINSIRQAIHLDNNHQESLHLIAELLLINGEFQEGWSKFADYWMNTDNWRNNPDIISPFWDDDINLSNHSSTRLLLHNPAGFDEEVFFARFIPYLARHGLIICIVTEPSLMEFWKNVKGVNYVYDINQLIPQHDVNLPIQCVPKVLNIKDNQTMPIQNNYLFRQIPQSTFYSGQQSLISSQPLKIGIAWEGVQAFVDTHIQTIPLHLFQQLSIKKSYTLYALQWGLSDLEKNESMSLGVMDQMANCENFWQLAGMINNLDVIITTDCIVAHLTGLQNKATILLVPEASSWYWGNENGQSYWYSSVRVLCDSDDNIENILAMLNELRISSVF